MSACSQWFFWGCSVGVCRYNAGLLRAGWNAGALTSYPDSHVIRTVTLSVQSRGIRFMLDIDLEEELVAKTGGKFALTYLLQRRLVELNRGDRPLVVVEGDEVDNRRIACQEILEGKIVLAPRAELESLEAEVKKRIEEPAPAPVEESMADDGSPFGSDIKKIKEQRIKELAQLLNPKK